MFTTQNGVVFDIGLLADRPAAAGVTKVGTLYYATDVSTLYILTNVGGVKAWSTGVGPGSGALGKYWVNVAGQQPVAPYTSVQAAVNAAAADGHGVANPTAVYIMPGVYVEEVTPVDGIDLIALGAWNYQKQGDVIIQAPAKSPALNLVNVATRLTVSGIAFIADSTSGNTSPAGLFNGGGYTLELINCRFVGQPVGLGGAQVSGVGVTATTPITVDAWFCSFEGSGNNGSLGIDETSAAANSYSFRLCQLQNSDVTSAVSFNASVGEFHDCTITGTFATTGAALEILFTTNLTVNGVAYLKLAAGTQLQWFSGRASGGSVVPNVTGSGAIEVSGLLTDSNDLTLASTINNGSSILVQNVYIVNQSIANGTVLTKLDADLYLIATGPGNVTFTLPASTAVLKGRRVRFRKALVGNPEVNNTLTITAAGTDTINGGPAGGTISTADPTDTIELQLNGTNWVLVNNPNLSGTNTTGTPGNATANTRQGTAAFAIGASTCVITNNLVAPGTHVFVQYEGTVGGGVQDATLTSILRVNKSSGSFTVTGNANATAATAFSWFIVPT